MPVPGFDGLAPVLHSRESLQMARIGGNLFEGVRFPVVFGDRFLAVYRDAVTGAPLVDVYRWDRGRNRLVAELFQGRPLAGAAPLTVEPIGRSGGVRLSVSSETDNVVGYLSGGDDPRSIIINSERIEIRHGETVVFTMVGSAFVGAEVGVLVAVDGSISIAGPAPEGTPTRTLFENANLVLTDLVDPYRSRISSTEFNGCRILGPAIFAAVGPIAMEHCELPGPNFVWELPPDEGGIPGLIGMSDCKFVSCQFENVAIATPRGTRDQLLARITSGS